MRGKVKASRAGLLAAALALGMLGVLVAARVLAQGVPPPPPPPPPPATTSRRAPATLEGRWEVTEQKAMDLQRAGQHTRALSLIQEFLSSDQWTGKNDWRRNQGAWVVRGFVYGLLARLHEQAGEYEQAAQAVQACLKETGDLRGPLASFAATDPVQQWIFEVCTNCYLALLYRKAGQAARALPLYEEAEHWYASGGSVPADWPAPEEPRRRQRARFARFRYYDIPVGEAVCSMQLGDPRAALKKLETVRRDLADPTTAALLAPAPAPAALKSMSPGQIKYAGVLTAFLTWGLRYRREVDLPLRLARCLIALKRLPEARDYLQAVAETLHDNNFVQKCPQQIWQVYVDDTEVTPDTLAHLRDVTIPNLLKKCSGGR